MTWSIQRARTGLRGPAQPGARSPSAAADVTAMPRPACRPGAGLRAARRHPLGEPRLACSPRAPTPSRGTPGPRASTSAHPFPGQLEPDRVRGTGSCRKMAAPGSSSELSGLPLCHVTRVPPPAPFLPPLLPSLSSPARPPPSLGRGKSGAAPARYVVEPARRAQQEARPRGRRGPPRHVTLPANRSPEAGPACRRGVGGGAARCTPPSPGGEDVGSSCRTSSR